MGVSGGKKTTTTNKPVYEQEIKGAHNITNETYQNNKGTAQDIAGGFASLVPSLLDEYKQGNRAIEAATDYSADASSGKFLGGNPHLQSIIDTTNDSVQNRTNAGLGMRGLTGSSSRGDILSRNLAENEGKLRYGDHQFERQQQANAAAMAPSLAAGKAATIAPALAAGEAAVNLPWVGANNTARNTAGLLGQYGTTTQKQSGGLLGSLLGAGLSGWASGGF